MILEIITTFLIMFVIITFFGYTVHRALHSRWSGRFYAAHMTHHFTLYPPEQFLSDKYLDPGKDNTAKFFFIAGLPIIFLPIILFAFHIIGWTIFLTAIITLAVIGIPHDYLHDHFHLRNTWLRRFKWFEKMTALHKNHHIDMTTNYGIYWFGWDKVFKTFWNSSDNE